VASPDVVLQAPDVVGVPMTYQVPAAQEIIPLAITAAIDGSGAGGQYLPTVEIVAPSGAVMARCPTTTIVAAGASANVSWFPLSRSPTSAATGLTPYEQLVLSTGGIQLYWKLDDAVGATQVVDSFDSHLGDVFGAVTFGQPKLADVTSALFAGGMCGKKVEIPGILGTQLMTLIVWFTTTSVAAVNTIAWADTSAPSGRWFQVYTDNTGKLNFNFFATDGTGFGVATPAAVNDGVKHSAMLRFTATTPSTGAGAVASIGIDGAIVTSSPIAMGGFGLANTNRSMVIGARWRNAFDDPNGTAPFAGRLDEYAVFNSAITDAQYAAIDAAGRVI